ncbi:MAG TPA: hypothetical protein VEX86_19485 [Longimicrobium sp.]|nr:hypothetical protein [Longimicrobium sp.]
MSEIGDVHNLPAEERPDADIKLERPWLLLHTPRTETPSWAFAYGGTQATEARLDAVPLSLAWTRASTRRLERSTFYPARLRTPVAGDTGTRVGQTAGAESRIRLAFRDALGIGAGPGRRVAPDQPERGRVVRLTRAVESDTDGARFAVLVTPDAYARVRRYQQLVPIYDLAEVEPQDGKVESDAPWVRSLPGTMETATLAVPGLFTGSEHRCPFTPGQIAALTEVRVDTGTLRRIDEALVAHFRL